MNSNAATTIEQMRRVRAAVAGCEMTCRIHSVKRVGDAGHAVVSVDAITARGRRSWTSGRMAVLLDTLDGRRPMFRGRTEAAARHVRVLSMALDRSRLDSLSYWVDSSAHYWCADNAPALYKG